VAAPTKHRIPNQIPDEYLDTQDKAADTAVHHATAAGDVEIVRLLAEQGVGLQVVNKTG
jgi:ankyrin repeat protein